MERESFIIDINNNIQKKYKEYKLKIDKHERNEFKLKIIYNVFGVISVILSSITTFLTGVYSFNSKELIISLCVIFSLIVTVINSALNFSNIQKKESQHHDNMLQFKHLCLDIDEFISNKNNSELEYENFYNLLIEKEKLITGYEINICFN